MNDFPNLPRSWQVKTLGEVCDILDNMRKPINATEREQRLKNSTHKYAYYGATGQVGYIDDFLCDFESILLGEDGAPFLEPFKDKAYIVSGKYWVNNHAHILTAKENLTSNKFLCHFLNIVDYMPYVSGTTRLKLNQSAMKQIKIPIPPLEIQRRIVKRLDEAFSQIENGTKHLQSAKDNLTKYKQSLLKSAFNGTLTQDCPLLQGESATPSLRDSARKRGIVAIHESLCDFRNDEDSPSLAEGVRGWVNPLNDNALDCHADKSARNDDKDSLNGKSANLPQGWTIKTLGEVCEKISAGGDRPNDCTAEKTQENQIPIFSNGIENNGLYGYTKTPTITKPALTISARGTIGFVCVRYEPFFPIVRLICAIPNDKVLVLEFLAYALRYLIPQGEGSSIPQLTIPNFKQIKIPIPPLETQKQIVAILDGHFTSADKVSAYINSCLTKAKQLKSSLLKSAFEGKLV